MPESVYLHVGAPKTGTTYLQSRLLRNQRELKAHGVTYPLGRLRDPRAHYFAALDVTGTPHGVDPRHVDGAWDNLVHAIRRAPGSVVVSHEVLAKADKEQAARALGDVEATGAAVHVVFTARDLARQLTSGWQEDLKYGSTLSFADFVKRSRRGKHPFARSFDVERVLTNWGERLPVSHLHLVTAPPPGSSRGLLWHRFLDAVDVQPEWAPHDAAQENASVGVPEAQLLRRLNRRLGDDAKRGGRYAELVNATLVPQALAPRDTARISLGPSDAQWVSERSDAWIGWLRERGVQVHGDLEDLRPTPPPDDWIDPDVPRHGQVAAAALDVVQTLMDEVEHERSLTDRLKGAVSRLRS
jgi:hypothetical protein